MFAFICWFYLFVGVLFIGGKFDNIWCWLSNKGFSLQDQLKDSSATVTILMRRSTVVSGKRRRVMCSGSLLASILTSILRFLEIKKIKANQNHIILLQKKLLILIIVVDLYVGLSDRWNRPLWNKHRNWVIYLYLGIC